MYRVYDTKEKRWVKHGISISPENDLLKATKTMFGRYKLDPIPDVRYIWQNAIEIEDKNGRMIYEGDICRASDGMIGEIAYAVETASYLFFDHAGQIWYPLGVTICRENLEVIGNVFDTPELLEPEKTSEIKVDN